MYGAVKGRAASSHKGDQRGRGRVQLSDVSMDRGGAEAGQTGETRREQSRGRGGLWSGQLYVGEGQPYVGSGAAIRWGGAAIRWVGGSHTWGRGSYTLSTEGQKCGGVKGARHNGVRGSRGKDQPDFLRRITDSFAAFCCRYCSLELDVTATQSNTFLGHVRWHSKLFWLRLF